LKSLSLLVGSLIGLFVLLEFVIFRFALPAADLPLLSVDSSKVIRYQENQTGTYRLQSEINARFQINEQGWNSKHESYRKAKTPGVLRICIIGDSYVEALQVDFDQSVAERLEEEFHERGIQAEVYRFGLSGAPLSQYVYWLEREVLQFQPDLVIINLVDNDFDQSITPARGTYSRSFATVKKTEGDFILTEPISYTRNFSWWVKKSAIFRYLWVREQIRPDTLRALFEKVARLSKNSNNPAGKEKVESATRSSDPNPVTSSVRTATDFLFAVLRDVSRVESLPVMLVMDGNRGTSSPNAILGKLNKMVQELAYSHQLPLLDLSELFAKDYAKHQRAHQFRFDGHWNAYAHSLVAGAIYSFISEEILPHLSEKI
jgi:hypothetical protein